MISPVSASAREFLRLAEWTFLSLPKKSAAYPENEKHRKAHKFAANDRVLSLDPIAAQPLLSEHITAHSSRSPGSIRLSALAWNILGYWDQCPHASDTLVIITRWWLLKQRIEMITRDVKGALDELVKLGFVVRVEGIGRDARYELKKKQLARLRRLLRQRKSKKSKNGNKQSI